MPQRHSKYKYENMTIWQGVQEGVSAQQEFNDRRQELWEKWRKMQTWEARGTSLPVKQIEIYNELQILKP